MQNLPSLRHLFGSQILQTMYSGQAGLNTATLYVAGKARAQALSNGWPQSYADALAFCALTAGTEIAFAVMVSGLNNVHDIIKWAV